MQAEPGIATHARCCMHCWAKTLLLHPLIKAPPGLRCRTVKAPHLARPTGPTAMTIAPTTAATTPISSPTAPTAGAGAALRAALQPTLDALTSQFSSTLAQAVESAWQRQQTPATTTTATATAPPASGDYNAPSLLQATGEKSTGTATAQPYLHPATADHDTRHRGKPDTATFMKATGADFSTASSLLYGVIGSNTDYRDWNAIMASSDPVQSARQATGALYNSDLPYTSGNGFKPSAAQTVAASGSFAWLNVDSREGLWLMNNQGEALRQLQVSAPDILRASRDFGVDTADLATLADQMDAKGAAQPSVDLRSLAQGGMGTAHDWTTDALAHLKGAGAQAAVAADALLAQELGLTRRNAGTSAAGASGTTSTNTAKAGSGTSPDGTASTASADITSAQALARQLTDTLLAQFQAALQGWEARATSGNTTQST